MNYELFRENGVKMSFYDYILCTVNYNQLKNKLKNKLRAKNKPLAGKASGWLIYSYVNI